MSTGGPAAGGRAGGRGRVLVARQDNVGDVLLTGPAVRAVAARASVAFLAAPKGAAAARLLPGVDEVVVEEAAWIGYDAPPVTRSGAAAFVDRLAGLGLDAALVLTSFHQSPLPLALLLRMAGVGPIAATSEDHPGSLVDARIRYRPELHEVDQNLAVAAALGFELPPGDDGRLAVDLTPHGPPGWQPGCPYVVVHPGASVPARAMRPELAASVVAALAERGYEVAVTGGPSEAALAAEVAGPAHPRVHDLGGALDLVGLAQLLRGARALVSGNTGPAHLAAAVGTPVVELFAPVVDPHRWRPYGVPATLLGQLDIACAGCRARQCPLPTQSCVETVGPGDVVEAVERLVNRPSTAGVAR